MWALAASAHRVWRSRRRPERAPRILVVGALRAGGSGKTDWADWLAARHPDLAILVHPTGDEDRWLEARHPGRVFRGRDLLDAWRAAANEGFRTAVSDGGLQDPALDGCPALLLGETSAGWAQLHPFGPFRERRASRPVRLSLEEGRDWSWDAESLPPDGSRVLLAAGVAKTESVISDLERGGVEVAGVLRTRDHGLFDRRAIARMERIHGALPWVITAKDEARGEVAGFARPPFVLRRRLFVEEHVAASVDALVESLS